MVPVNEFPHHGTVLWLLVAFNNMGEVDDYVAHLDAVRPEGATFRYAICDNSAVPTDSAHAARRDVVTTSRPDNPGYLDGAISGLRAAKVLRWPEPTWVALSNTDLRWMGVFPLEVLEKHTPTTPVVVAPRITEGPVAVEKNPHVLSRRSLRRLRLNAWVAKSPLTMMAYQVAALLRIRFSAKGQDSRLDAEVWSQAYPAGTTFYSPYGALIFFSAGFDADANLPEGVPLYAEEYFVAESAMALNAPVIYEPQLHVHHDAHTTTGPKVAWGRAARTRAAFEAIRNHAEKVQRK